MMILYLNRNLPGLGYITPKVLKEILLELDNKLTDDELNDIVDEVDSDGSGSIDFDGEH